MKICIKCGIEKRSSLFKQCSASKKDGLGSVCKRCSNEFSMEQYRTKIGLLKSRYSSQKTRSKRRGHPLPRYTKDEFIEWALSDDSFNDLYAKWVESNYEKDLAPSVDRLRDDEGYYFGNIQIITWKENNDKFQNCFCSSNEKNATGTNKIAVRQYTKDGFFLNEYSSIALAAITTNTKATSICRVCKNKKKSANGFVWVYKDKR